MEEYNRQLDSEMEEGQTIYRQSFGHISHASKEQFIQQLCTTAL